MWNFTNEEEKISFEDVRYWKNNFNKILKVGLEFEFNLQNKKGTCNASSTNCECMHHNKNCWKICADKECEVRSEDCNCLEFKNPCSACKNFETDCLSCKHLIDPKSDPEKVRNNLKKEFEPSHSYGKINKSGVYDVVPDGSLLGGEGNNKGAEVITTGRRLDYWEMYNMVKNIIDTTIAKGGYFNERSSIHFHYLSSYYTGGGMIDKYSELEKPLPEVVMKNLHQLCRKYQNAITWMSMGLGEGDSLTRWEKYRQSILNVSPLFSNMKGVIKKMEKKTEKDNGKYGWINYMFTKFNMENEITRFHVEMRAMDGNESPSIITSVACLYYALVIKAIEISRYGILTFNDEEELERLNTMKEKILNNCPRGWSKDRFAIYYLEQEDERELTEQSLDLISQLKHLLFNKGPAYEILERLAETPAAILRKRGITWEEIENRIGSKLEVVDEYQDKLDFIIDTRAFICPKEEWIGKVNLEVGQDMTEAIEYNILNGYYMWSSSLKTMMRI